MHMWNEKPISGLLGLRNRHFFLLDLCFVAVAPALALMLRTDSAQSLEHYATALQVFILVALVVRVPVFYYAGFYRRYWRYASIEELELIAGATACSTAVVFVAYWGMMALTRNYTQLAAVYPLPRSIPLIDALLLLALIGGSRFSMRLVALWTHRNGRSAHKRVVIVGTTQEGISIAREIQRTANLNMVVVGFIDASGDMLHMQIHGTHVLGTLTHLENILHQHHVESVIIALPDAPGLVIRNITEVTKRMGVEAQIVPGLHELIAGSVTIERVRRVELEDLLRREAVRIDVGEVQALLQGKRVLVTGAGGSIGGELCRQVLACEPSVLVLVDHGENAIFQIESELRRFVAAANHATDPQIDVGAGLSAPTGCPKTKIRSFISDIRFGGRIRDIFQELQPHVVFHAAAHKHVPLMEMNPTEAIMNNVVGTENVVQAAMAAKVSNFVMISTDKAVNPVSIMGASKRVGELMVLDAARASGKPYVAVRFGNVLGSSGSVVPTFKQQIAAGGPVTVTHPDVRRYFMTTSEAVQLVLQATALGQTGEVFLLDMGEPVRIVDLARTLIDLSGQQVGRDIEIVYTGLRPGEKLYEELFTSGETYQRTKHAKILTVTNASESIPMRLHTLVNRLRQVAEHNDREEIVNALQALVPEYAPVQHGPSTPIARVEHGAEHTSSIRSAKAMVGQRKPSALWSA